MKRDVNNITNLIFAPLAPIGSFNVEHEQVAVGRLAHPDSLCSLAPSLFVHHVEARAKKAIQKRALTSDY